LDKTSYGQNITWTKLVNPYVIVIGWN